MSNQQSSQNSLPATLEGPPSPSYGSMVLVTDRYGGTINSSAQSREGYYETADFLSDGRNILYTDFATQTRVFLCARPNCTHSDDTCTSWFVGMAGGTIFLDKNEKYLFYMMEGFADDPNPSTNNLGRLYRMEKNGSNREIFYELKANESFMDAVVSDDENIYVSVFRVESGGTGVEIVKEIHQININDGTVTLVRAIAPNQERIIAAFDGIIVLEKADGVNLSYIGYSVPKDEEQLLYSYVWNDVKSVDFPVGERLYQLVPTSSTTAKINLIHLGSGEATVLLDEIAMFGSVATYINSIWDNRLQIYCADNRDVSNIIETNYIFDIQTGNLTEHQLLYDFYGMNRPVAILADAGDYYLVRNAIDYGEVTITDQDGVPYTVETDIPLFSLILKSDYWNFVPNHISITDMTRL